MSDSFALSKSCPKCGTVLPSEATEGLCPKCLMNEAMEPTLISDASKPRGAAILAPEELAPHFPAYEILRMLGRGGMGAVYLARQISLNRLVAIKLLPADMNEGEINFADRFKNEAQAMAQLNHPGIVAVHDFGQTANGLLFIVMEYIEGTDVQLMLASQGRLHSAHAMAITAHVCDALQYAHTRGIIHRDIKPSNIMVSNDGVVKVADFGLAKMSHGQTTGLTQSGMAMGTLHFMAPEALTLGSAVDQRADIYAVGVMLYQMLTGRLPQGMFEMPSFQVTGLDPRYDRIVARALRDDRELRYQAANELRYDLDAILTQPVEKVAPETAEDVAALPPVEQREKKRAPQHMPRVKTEVPAAEDSKAKPHKHSVFGWMAALMTLAAAGLAVWFVLFSKPSQFADAPDTEGWHDLMQLIEPKRDAVNGLWAMKNGELICKPAPWALCEVPLKYVGGNYDYRISLTRGEGDQLAVFFPFRKGDAAGDVVFDYFQPTFTTGKRAGLENVAGASLSSEEDQVSKTGGVVRFRKEWIPCGVKCIVLIQVRDEGVCVSLNGEEVWRWKGEWAWVTQTHGFDNLLFQKLDGRKVFGVGIYGCEATFHSIQMREVPEQEGKMLPPEVSKTTQPDALAEGTVQQSSGPVIAATKEKPFINSLGMKFVPVPGTKALMCIHETRFKDYAAYAKETAGGDGSWLRRTISGFTPADRTDEHPVMNVNWNDAKAFCAWLSQKEGQTYRLPTDREWSSAVGLDETWDAGMPPAPGIINRTDYPWGRQWPPPAGAGNYSDQSRKRLAPADGAAYIENYDDGFPLTAPVMSFKPNVLGIYDLGGNVFEWCEGEGLNTKLKAGEHVWRGSSWYQDDRNSHGALMSSYRGNADSTLRNGGSGFRVMLEIKPAAE